MSFPCQKRETFRKLVLQQVGVQLIAGSLWLHHALQGAAMLVVSDSSLGLSQSRADPATRDYDSELELTPLLPSEP